MHYFKQLFKVDKAKLDFQKGLKQTLLMLIALLPFYYFGHLSLGLLVSMGTLSHIYVFGKTLRSKVKAIVISTFTLALAMFLGSITANHMLLFGIILLLFTVVPYYICIVLQIKGPSSTFFLVAYGLSSIMPFDPSMSFMRAGSVLLGGLLTLLLIYIESLLKKDTPIENYITQELDMLKDLMQHIDDKAFDEKQRKMYELGQVITATIKGYEPLLHKGDTNYYRMLMIHHLIESIYREILDYRAQGIKVLPPVLNDSLSYIRSKVMGYPEKWTEKIEVAPVYDRFIQHIFDMEEILDAPLKQLDNKVKIHEAHFTDRLIHNLNLKSSVFINTLKYAVIMSIAIMVALLCHIDRPYWVALSVHTVLLGNTSVHRLERASSRFIGTAIGLIIAVFVIKMEPSMVVVLIIIAIAGGVNEVLVASNYTLAMFSITTQVVMMSGIAVGHMSEQFAYLRVFDVSIGVFIAVTGIIIFGTQMNAKTISYRIADTIRLEAVIFHQLFQKKTAPEKFMNHAYFEAYQSLMNAKMTYQNAYGEIKKDKALIMSYYPFINTLEQIHFSLLKMRTHEIKALSDQDMGTYLLAFENVAKHLEIQDDKTIITLPDIQAYHYLKQQIDELQKTTL